MKNVIYSNINLQFAEKLKIKSYNSEFHQLTNIKSSH